LAQVDISLLISWQAGARLALERALGQPAPATPLARFYELDPGATRMNPPDNGARMTRRPPPPGAVLVTRDLRYMVLVAAARHGRDGGGEGGVGGYFERLAARKLSSAKLRQIQAAGSVAIAVELLDPKEIIP
jgi:hypothetical protein